LGRCLSHVSDKALSSFNPLGSTGKRPTFLYPFMPTLGFRELKQAPSFQFLGLTFLFVTLFFYRLAPEAPPYRPFPHFLHGEISFLPYCSRTKYFLFPSFFLVDGPGPFFALSSICRSPPNFSTMSPQRFFQWIAPAHSVPFPLHPLLSDSRQFFSSPWCSAGASFSRKKLSLCSLRSPPAFSSFFAPPGMSKAHWTASFFGFLCCHPTFFDVSLSVPTGSKFGPFPSCFSLFWTSRLARLCICDCDSRMGFG